MLVAKSRDISYSEVTPKSLYLNRRSCCLVFPQHFCRLAHRLLPGLGTW